MAARRSVPCPEVPAEVARILGIYLDKRLPGETFTAFAARHSGPELQALFEGGPAAAESAPSEAIHANQGLSLAGEGA